MPPGSVNDCRRAISHGCAVHTRIASAAALASDPASTAWSRYVMPVTSTGQGARWMVEPLTLPSVSRRRPV